MPSTRTELTREQKVEEILDAAQQRLEAGGHDALSVAALARELGVAQNAIYHYFASRDALFVAVLERMLGEIAARKPRGAGTEARILWFVDQLAALAPYRPALYEGRDRSPDIGAFTTRIDELLDRMLTNAFTELGVTTNVALTVRTFRALVEGTYVQRLPRAERRRVLTHALRRLAP
jgi:AcrR family transcriptional regulator